MKDLLYKIALTKIPSVGAVTARHLVSYCGGAEEVFRAKRTELTKIPGVGDMTATSILQSNALQEAEKELLFVEKEDITPLFYLDKQFPIRLKNIHDAPILLYYKGVANLNRQRVIGIIGTRTPTAQGLSICDEIVNDLKVFNPLIISGLAYGIDVAAHRKSLEVGLETVAVLGHGLSRIYPHEHRKTAFDMVSQGGLLTEFASTTGPERENFPMRNRIVAGICDAIIVVETAARGGSMITAMQANNYQRDVFAVPGRVRDKFSQGCHALIKSSNAQLMESAADLVRHLRWQLSEEEEEGSKPTQPLLFYELTEPEKLVVDFIQKEEEVGIDQLSYGTKLHVSEIAATLLELEFRGLVRSLPGKRFVLS